MANHTLSQDLVIKAVYDPETEALKVKFPAQEMAIAISKEDGDSVIIHNNTITASRNANEVVDILGTTQVSIYADQDSIVEFSPVMDADIFVLGVVGTNIICAARVKCNKPFHVVAI